MPVLAFGVYEFVPSVDNVETIGSAQKAWRTGHFYEIKTGLQKNALWVSTAPTISSGFGTSPSIAANNGTAAFTVNVGTGGTAYAGVIGLPMHVAATGDGQGTQGATNGWVCQCTDLSTITAGICMASASSCSNGACTVTVTNEVPQAAGGLAHGAWTSGDVLGVQCGAY
jgi:hypothetical protein